MLDQLPPGFVLQSVVPLLRRADRASLACCSRAWAGQARENHTAWWSQDRERLVIMDDADAHRAWRLLSRPLLTAELFLNVAVSPGDGLLAGVVSCMAGLRRLRIDIRPVETQPLAYVPCHLLEPLHRLEALSLCVGPEPVRCIKLGCMAGLRGLRCLGVRNARRTVNGARLEAYSLPAGLEQLRAQLIHELPWDLMAEAPQLRAVTLIDCMGALPSLSRLTRLEDLRLVDCWFAYSRLPTGLRALRVEVLDDLPRGMPREDDGGGWRLCRLSRLQHLTLAREDPDVAELARLTTLTSLVLDSCYMPTRGGFDWSAFGSLRCLRLTIVGKVRLDTLPPSLEHLAVSFALHFSSDWVHQPLEDLVDLRMGQGEQFDLSRTPRLTSLHLSHARLWGNLAQLSQLVHFASV